LDIIDTDPVRLAARSLVAHIRAEQYSDSLLPAEDYVWESDEAVEAVLKFLKDHAK
jgi:hypothetical protein